MHARYQILLCKLVVCINKLHMSFPPLLIVCSMAHFIVSFHNVEVKLFCY